MTKVSFIIPVYKVPLKFLKACLDSLVSQSMQECEFIVISDGASKEENTICEEYTSKDHRFRFYKQKHAGVSAARNFGLKQIRGEYIAFVDADDWIEPQMADLCYSFAKERSADIITMDFLESKNGIELLRLQKPKSLQPLKVLAQIIDGNLFGGVWLRVIRRSFYNKHATEFPISLGYCEDVVFYAQILQKKPKIDYLNKAFYHYIQDNNKSITHDFTTDKYKERKKFIQILKDILPRTFERDINMAAFNVKMEAMRNNLLTPADYTSFERTRLSTLFRSNQSWITKIYLLLHTILLTIFNKTYKEYL